MKEIIRLTQLVGAAIVLVATTIAFCLEILKMANVQSIELADLLLLFIYLEVMGMVGNYWSNQSIRLTYPFVHRYYSIIKTNYFTKKRH